MSYSRRGWGEVAPGGAGGRGLRLQELSRGPVAAVPSTRDPHQSSLSPLPAPYTRRSKLGVYRIQAKHLFSLVVDRAPQSRFFLVALKTVQAITS